MVRLLARLLIRNRDDVSSPAVRKAYGVLCGALGIVLNVLLFAGKFFAGTVSGSVSITADAFNNLSDAGSSVITLAGFELGSQKADREHPFGHGRIEYLSGLLVALLILLMGVELAKSSVEKILHPAPVSYPAAALVILACSIGVKLYMFSYNRSVGKKIGSAAMGAAAADSLSDSVATLAVLTAALVERGTGARIDGWCGVLVAGFILHSGWGAVRDTLDPLLGQPPTPEFVQKIRDLVLAHPQILGIHDLIVHDYGPGRVMISLHAEVSAAENIVEIHDVVDNVERELNEKLDCHAVIHMDPIQTNDQAMEQLRAQVAQRVHALSPEISIHDFRIVAGPTHTNVIFDAVVPYGFGTPDEEVARQIRAAVRELGETYYAVVHVERPYI